MEQQLLPDCSFAAEDGAKTRTQWYIRYAIVTHGDAHHSAGGLLPWTLFARAILAMVGTTTSTTTTAPLRRRHHLRNLYAIFGLDENSKNVTPQTNRRSCVKLRQLPSGSAIMYQH